ncbi:TetR/AcrR family transcriptional regulator [Mangrovimonas sp. CR14]|uniref:TetR/AcrR family transcriptional regulator n=1 Tax=Mangrovimonas sp. CR14 TaxID=2706120 RepID=UPI001421BC57|nr:TetR/AcrR family transcriptional regulator [Mangrovimonas sp. CR14]NIK91827.1 TetR/AcrR family transcriptional regulator [Mangrovimonas sp. CR14]
MKSLLHHLKITVSEKVYIKDPETSDLGKRIVSESILMIDEMGFECFTFKKLGEKLGSNESSMYRYFESKHKLLLYLTSWYWAWLEYQLVFETHSLTDPEEKLLKGIQVITRSTTEDSTFSHINEVALNRIVINENSKSFLTKQVDQENKDGVFNIYKNLVLRIRDMIHEVNADYPFPESLSSTVVEGALHQHFLKDHFKTLTNAGEEESSTKYFQHLVLNTINSKTQIL